MSNKDFSPVQYRFYQFLDELLHYTGIGNGTSWARKFCTFCDEKSNNYQELESVCKNAVQYFDHNMFNFQYEKMAYHINEMKRILDL